MSYASPDDNYVKHVVGKIGPTEPVT